MASYNIEEADALKYLEEVMKTKPEDYSNYLRQRRNELKIEKTIKARERASKEQEVRELETERVRVSDECDQVQEELIVLQKKIHWMETMDQKNQKNEQELNKQL